MKTLDQKSKRQCGAMELARKHVRQGPGSLIRATDLVGATPAAASKALSRLAGQGEIRRVRKGLYYVPKATLLGESRPSESAVVRKVLNHRARPTGMTAANALGLTTQLPSRPEYAVYASATPRGLETARLRMRSRTQTGDLEPQDAALLEFIRDRGRHGELGAQETYARVRLLLTGGKELSKSGSTTLRIQRLRDAALLEPPRVRAILGALMVHAGFPPTLWKPLRESLNPFSRFNFGLFRELPNAREWQAK